MESLKQERRLPPIDSVGITPPRGRQGHSVPTPQPLSTVEKLRQPAAMAKHLPKEADEKEKQGETKVRGLFGGRA